MNTNLYRLTKILAFEITVLIFLLNIGIHSQIICEKNDKNISCPPPKRSFQCGLGSPTLLTMQDEEKKSIVNIINEFRKKIAEGKMNLEVLGKSNVTLNQAASMTILQWDDALAEKAKEKIVVCSRGNFHMDEINIGKIEAKAIYLHFDNRSTENLRRALQDNFLYDAQHFNVSLLTDYEWSTFYDYFTMLAHHESLFIGCAIAEAPWKAFLSVCYLAFSEESYHNMLYKPGPQCSECPFNHIGYHCSSDQILCDRPPWNISDPKTQSATFLQGFENLVETTKTSPTSTSTASIQPLQQLQL